MFIALNMELEIVRTVRKNEVNEIYVCTNTRHGMGEFYTVISIQDEAVRKEIAELAGTRQLFPGNQDYVGSFAGAAKFNLVFRYYKENLLDAMKNIYLYKFADCKNAAANLVAAFAEAGADGPLGTLLLEQRNVNLSREGNISLNYFLDFAEYSSRVTEEDFLLALAGRVFEILETSYVGRYESPELYPNDIRLFYLKMKRGGFDSYGQIITSIRAMSDNPIEVRGLLWWFRSRIRRTRGFLFRNSMHAFLTILVLVTIIYAGVEIGKRVQAKSINEKNMSYNGIEYIGDVYLGNKE